MNLEAALRAHLLAQLGALVGTRVYIVGLPQGVTLPALTFQRISTPVLQHKGDSDFAKVRMQIDAYAADYAGTAQLRAAIRGAMKTFKRGASPRVDKALLHDMRDLFDPNINRWRVSMDFYIWVDEG